MQRLNQFFKNPASASVLLTALSALPLAIKFFLLPIYLKLLDPEEYGMLAIVYIFTSLYELLGNLRVQTSVETFYFDYFEDKSKLKKYISNIFTFSVLFSFVILILSFIFGQAILDLTIKTDGVSFYPDFFIAMLTSFMLINIRIFYSYIKNNKSFLKFAIYNISTALLTIGLQLYFLWGRGMGITGILLGSMIGAAIVFIYFICTNLDLLTFKLDKNFIRPSLNYSVALLPFLIFFWANQKIDRFFLEHLLDLSWVGKYAALVAIANLVQMIVSSAMSSFKPFLFRAFKGGVEENESSILSLERVYVYMVLGAASLIILAGANSDFIIVNDKYIEIIYLIPLATIVPVLLGFAILFNQQLIFSKNAKRISGVSVIAFIFVMPLYYFLIPDYQLEGLIYANILGNGIVAVLFYYYGQKYFPVKHDWRAIFLLPFLFYLMILGLQYCIEIELISYRVMGFIQFIIFIVTILFMGRKDVMDFLRFQNN